MLTTAIASSNRSNRSIAILRLASLHSGQALSSNRLKKQTWNVEIREFSKGGRWSEAIAVASLAFVERVKSELGIKAVHREGTEVTGTYTLRKQSEAYGANLGGESEALRPENTIFRDENAEITET